MTRAEARARYQHALAHPEPMGVSGRLILGIGWGLLLAVPLWLGIFGLYWLVAWVLRQVGW